MQVFAIGVQRGMDEVNHLVVSKEIQISGMETEIKILNEKIDKYTQALEFYADRNNWKFQSYKNDCKDMIDFGDVGVKSYNENADFACGSGGRRAREALKGGE